MIIRKVEGEAGLWCSCCLRDLDKGAVFLRCHSDGAKWPLQSTTDGIRILCPVCNFSAINSPELLPLYNSLSTQEIEALVDCGYFGGIQTEALLGHRIDYYPEPKYTFSVNNPPKEFSDTVDELVEKYRKVLVSRFDGKSTITQFNDFVLAHFKLDDKDEDATLYALIIAVHVEVFRYWNSSAEVRDRLELQRLYTSKKNRR